MRKRTVLIPFALFCLAALAVMIGCSSGNGGLSHPKGAGVGAINLTVSDPATCSAPQGPYTSIFITVADVQVHTSATATPTDPGWVDLTPNLTPIQINLLGTPNASCFLATLGTNIQVAPDTFQQLRLILLDDGRATQIANNQCGAGVSNCVVLASNGSKQPISLTSETQTGIKVPPGQFSNGPFTLNNGDTRNLNIDFDACASIVVQGNGQFRLKPVVHVGEVNTTSTSITGKVVDSLTRAVITGGKVVVALEQVDSTGTSRVVMETVPDISGNFVFCPVAAGTYEVVAVAINGLGVAYAATITTGVQPGNVLTQVPLNAETGTNTSPATITGQVTTSSTAGAGTSADISLSPLQSIAIGTATVAITIPQAATTSATLSLATATGTTCPANTQCASYTMQVPAANPSVGAFSSAGTTYTQASGAASYTLDALAFVPNSGNVPNCTPPEQKTTSLAVTAGATTNAPVLAFTGCQ